MGPQDPRRFNPDVAVIAHLEQGFLADDGAEYISGKAFERESSLGISSKTYGTLKWAVCLLCLPAPELPAF